MAMLLLVITTTTIARPALASTTNAVDTFGDFTDIRGLFKLPPQEIIYKGWTETVPWCRVVPQPGSFRSRVLVAITK